MLRIRNSEGERNLLLGRNETSRPSCEATYRNVIEAERDPEVSCPWTTKPFPTDSKVDDELAQRKFTFLSGEIC
jgi:hypothetical protein